MIYNVRINEYKRWSVITIKISGDEHASFLSACDITYVILPHS